MPAFKGFQVVEVKANRRDKNKIRSDEHEEQFSPTAASFKAEPKPKTATELEKSKRLPGENPIDPRAVKADLKASRSLQKNYANQTAGGTTSSSAATSASPKQPTQTVDLGAWGTASRPATGTTKTSVSIPTHTSAGGWGKTDSKSRGTGALSDSSNFMGLPSSGPDMQADVRIAGGPKVQKLKDEPKLGWADGKGKGSAKGGKQQEPEHVAHTLVIGKKVAPKQSHTVEADVDEIESPSGDTALPISIAAVMLTTDGKAKEIPLSGSLDKMNQKAEQYISGMPKSATAAAQLPIRGGLYMTVAGKKFSDISTIYEPWMAESYFKALIPIVEGETDHGVAHPYWPVSSSGQKDAEAAEADVTMKLIRANPKDALFAPTTLIELEHVSHHQTLKVQVKKIRVSFKSFATGMLRAGEQLVAFRESLEDVFENSPLKGAAAAEVTSKFAGKMNKTVATFKAALEKATA